MCRCYIRGWTPLGLFNTITGCLFNRVVVKVVHTYNRWDGTYRLNTYHWEKAEDYDEKTGRCS